jgi:hypothetical protein
VHLHRYVEAWPGGFHRDAEQDAKILAAHPLPSDRLELDGVRVAGHQVSYRGRLVVAFRSNSNGALLAFGGYGCDAIRLDGVEQRFAERPLEFVAWAPVTAERRAPGGALMEFWVQGEGELRIPLPEGVRSARIFNASPRPGEVGDAVPARIENGCLIFEAGSPRGRRHGYVLPG